MSLTQLGTAEHRDDNVLQLVLHLLGTLAGTKRETFINMINTKHTVS